MLGVRPIKLNIQNALCEQAPSSILYIHFAWLNWYKKYTYLNRNISYLKKICYNIKVLYSHKKKNKNGGFDMAAEKNFGKEKRVNKFVLIIITIIDLFLFFGYIGD